MKKNKKIISTLLGVVLMLNLMIGNVFAVESKVDLGKESTIDVYVKEHADEFEVLEKNTKINLSPNKESFYSVHIDDTEYILKVGLSDSADSVGIRKDINTNAVQAVQGNTHTAYAELYSKAGILNGSLTMKQYWEYDNGAFTYTPAPTLQESVPWYGFPNYWSNLFVSSPSYNSSTKKYTSQGQGTLNLSIPTPIGALTFQSFIAYLSITFDANGKASSSVSWK